MATNATGVGRVRESDLPLTMHALERMRQRGVGPEAVDAVLAHGRSFSASGGCTATVVTGLDVMTARENGFRIEEYRGLAVVEAPDGAVITVMHVSAIPYFWKAMRTSRRGQKRIGQTGAGRQRHSYGHDIDFGDWRSNRMEIPDVERQHWCEPFGIARSNQGDDDGWKGRQRQQGQQRSCWMAQWQIW